MKDESIRKEKKAKCKKEQSDSDELDFKRKCLKDVDKSKQNARVPSELAGIQVEANIQTSNVSPEDMMITIHQSEFTKLLDFIQYILSNT